MLRNPFNRRRAEEPQDGLHDLLQQWQAVDPRPDFEACVWRRLREEPAPQTSVVMRPAFLPVSAGWLAAAASLGILAGVWLATASAPSPSFRTAHNTLLEPGSLAGAYLAMTGGGVR